MRRERRAPKLGFLGVGWIGRHRMEAVVASGLAEVAAIADPAPELLAEAAKLAPGAKLASSLEELLLQDLDGVVIATPSALHAAQAIAAFERGLAVFCQKPLGRTATEVRHVVEAARRADRLLGVDLSYRRTEALRTVRRLVQSGELGTVFAVEAVFHNAYGPDKAWFYDRARSGGGAVIDLGVHLVDAALWTLGFPVVTGVTSRLHAGGAALRPDPAEVEDHAVARLDLAGGAVVNLACSWRLHAGQDAVIRLAFYGTSGGAQVANVGGSFYDLVAERFRGTARDVMVQPPDAWGGRTVVAFASQLALDPRFNPEEAEGLEETAEAIDAIYQGTLR